MNEDWEDNDSVSYKRMHKNHKLQWEFINTFIAERDIKSILDVGCGNHNLYNFSGDWVGIDVNTTLKNDKIITADFLDYKFDREFDMVLIAGVVEHYKLEQFKTFIKAALKVNPKYILITLFMGIKEKNSRISSLITSKKNYKISRFGKLSIKRVMEELNLDDYSIEELLRRSTVIIIRRESNG